LRSASVTILFPMKFSK